MVESRTTRALIAYTALTGFLLGSMWAVKRYVLDVPYEKRIEVETEPRETLRKTRGDNNSSQLEQQVSEKKHEVRSEPVVEQSETKQVIDEEPYSASTTRIKIADIGELTVGEDGKKTLEAMITENGTNKKVTLNVEGGKLNLNVENGSPLEYELENVNVQDVQLLEYDGRLALGISGDSVTDLENGEKLNQRYGALLDLKDNKLTKLFDENGAMNQTYSFLSTGATPFIVQRESEGSSTRLIIRRLVKDGQVLMSERTYHTGPISGDVSEVEMFELGLDRYRLELRSKEGMNAVGCPKILKVGNNRFEEE